MITFLTPPVEEGHLIEFYRRIRAGGVGWRVMADKVPDVRQDTGFSWLFLDWVCGVILVYMFLFGTGKLIFGEWLTGSLLLVVAMAAASVIYWDLSRRGWEEVTG